MSTALYDVTAPKKPTNLSLNSDLLQRARAERINLSQLLEASLVELLRARQRDAWLARNRAALEGYNARIARDGIFSDGLRSF